MSQLAGVGTSAGAIRTDYMNLLIVQLRHQNPLEPMSSEQMASQLTQLAQLEQVERLSSTFEKVLESEQTGQAAGMIGKQVSFRAEGLLEPYVGTVKGVKLSGDEISLIVDDYVVSLDAIQSVGSGLGSAYSSMVLAEKVHEVSNLIGKQVSFIPEVDEEGLSFPFGTIPEAVMGVVESVESDGSKVILTVRHHRVDFDKILSVMG